MKSVFFSFLLCCSFTLQAQDFQTPFEKDPASTATYFETIEFYKNLAKAYPKKLQLLPHGTTDSGHPLHTVVVNKDGDFEATSIRKKGKLVLFVNNAIHSGESCGVDASMLLIRDILQEKIDSRLLENTVLVSIPFYNIGGGLNRGSHSRTNQNGPKEHGFRGNAKNLDLNRDFIKCDSRNAQTFNQIYNTWQPDIFIDNHTSNGADYQYTLTLIATQENKLHPVLSDYMTDQLLPFLSEDMEQRNWEMTPYVYARNTPDDGIAAFLDLPRYSSGYAAVHHAISFMPETHMLKPYQDRVKSTYHFMASMLNAMHLQKDEIQAARAKVFEEVPNQTTFDLNWTLDRERQDTILFKGYAAKYKLSVVSGLDRLYYDHDAPYEKEIPYFRYYQATLSVDKPIAYIIPQAYQEVVERLRWNGVTVHRLTTDQVLDVEMYRIKDFKTRNAYEGHYLHYDTKVNTESTEWTYHEGDYVVFTDQTSNRYIVETLEPQAPDSFFAWNFFDGILMQKEHFSAYVFEDLAAEYLAKNPDLKTALEQKKRDDPEFAKDGYAQLNFVYERTPHYEPTHNLYPVGRLRSVERLKWE